MGAQTTVYFKLVASTGAPKVMLVGRVDWTAKVCGMMTFLMTLFVLEGYSG
ncbi:hypothetical protein Ocin01_06218 [Orchesella cincta]|uniref:Uncharacterized protein n=1 Tax=Orchesella cincta TaxID=48709 RepID=A0A1D2N678_ORCCI|nr:hypothetical protein Ocin01_06218 [Orchesella cincta]